MVNFRNNPSSTTLLTVIILLLFGLFSWGFGQTSSEKTDEEIFEEMLQGPEGPIPGQPILASMYTLSDSELVYYLGIGDKIELTFYEQYSLEDDGKRSEEVIQTDGTIYFSLLGVVYAVGKTVDELKDEIEKRLSEFIEAPVVRIRLLSSVSRRITLLGEFKKQGVYPLIGETRLTDFIAESGGLTVSADSRQVWVIRKNNDRILVNLEAYYKDGDINQDLLLVSGDRIYVPVKKESTIITLGRYAQLVVAFLQIVTIVILLAQG